MADFKTQIDSQLRLAKTAKSFLAVASSEDKNLALELIKKALISHSAQILTANAADVAQGEQRGLGAMIDRLRLTEKRILAIANSIDKIIALPDPIGEVVYQYSNPEGIAVEMRRYPLGIVGMVYESRPNVTVDAACLCLKAGNAVILKGGSDAIETNRAIVDILRQTLSTTAVAVDAINLINATDRRATEYLLQQSNYIDVIIPRGSSKLINFVKSVSSIPTIETGASVVHAYVDAEADVTKTVPLIINSKMRRVSICSALDTLLVHKDILPTVAKPLAEAISKTDPQLNIYADRASLEALKPWLGSKQLAAVVPDEHYGYEFLDYKMAVRVVASLDEALAHIEEHSLHHTEAIFTDNAQTADIFLRRIDSACLMHNASTQFSDGEEFGLGAEIGISTQKLHVRGPFALNGLTSTKWSTKGNYQVRSLV